MAPAFIMDALESAVLRHGNGAVFMLLESITRCHIVKIDASVDGVFLKSFYDKKARHSPQSVCSTSAASSSVISRDEILQHHNKSGKPPGAIRCVPVFNTAAKDNVSDTETVTTASQSDDGNLNSPVSTSRSGLSEGFAKLDETTGEEDDEDAQPLTEREKEELQEKIDQFDDGQLDRAFSVLKHDIGAIEEEEVEVNLDVDGLPPWKQRRFFEFVKKEFRRGPRRARCREAQTLTFTSFVKQMKKK